MKFYFSTNHFESRKPVKFLGFTLKEMPTIDFISIGIVCENGAEYFALNLEVDLDYVKKNGYMMEGVKHLPTQSFNGSNISEVKYWRSIKQIREDIKEFVYKNSRIGNPYQISNWYQIQHAYPVELFTYRGAHHWLLFRTIFEEYDYQSFGKVSSQPRGFPEHMIDLHSLVCGGIPNPDEWMRDNCPQSDEYKTPLEKATWIMLLHDKLMKYKENGA